jgi:hypothetical protein
MKLETIKDTISRAQLELGIAQRAVQTAVGSSDQDIVQMVALLSAVADEVLIEEPYRTSLGDGTWLHDSNGNPVLRPTSDSDVILFDARLAVDGLKYRFLKAKTLEYGEELRDFTNRLNKLASRANGRVIDLYNDGGRIL